ncbi:MAG: hypothetical protein M3235_04220 [Actinomycetota bacterium]|nr:hypothetical protein [Actinomycetota bacterium]
MTGATELTDQERETVFLLGEALIPEHGRGPSADQAGLASTFVDQALALRPDLAPDFRAQLAAARGAEPRAFCEMLRASDPAAFERLTFVLTGAYLLSPVARRWLGYEGQQGELQDGSVQPEYGPQGLLDAVRARGPIYLRTP